MTFHTFEAGTYLYGDRFRIINEKFKEYGSAYYKDTKTRDRKIFNGLSGNGITIYLYKRDIDDGFIYHLTYRVNPTRINNGNDYINLFHSNEAYDIFDKVNELLKSVSDSLPRLNDCILTRFDFCSNILFEKPETVPELIWLINVSYTANNKYVQKMNYDERAGRYVMPRTEATSTHPDYVEVSFYNKIYQMKTENLHIDWNPNVLRCEIRCGKNYINILRRKFKLKSIEDFFDNLPEMGTYMFTTQLKRLGLSYTYFRLDEIADKVDQSNLMDRTKRRIKEFTKYAAVHKGIMDARCKKSSAGLAQLRELNICAMPIPRRSSVPSGINLPDLCLKFADAKAVGG